MRKAKKIREKSEEEWMSCCALLETDELVKREICGKTMERKESL
jgi:hypothetical protein